MKFQLQRYGERAILINNIVLAEQLSLSKILERSPPLGFVEYVFGYSNVLVVFRSAEFTSWFKEWLKGITLESSVDFDSSRLVEVPTRYNGADIERVAEAAQMSVAQVVALHSETEYRVRMIGFSPGFPYLDGLDSRLHLNRRTSPRNRIEPGSVAIGGPHAGIYSVASPGGWHLLGSTDLKLFQPDRAMNGVPDAFIAMRPGDRVQFIPID